ncbi:hypothetical protein PBOI14_52650 [Pseudomonas sp. Boi14]|nr:hypothetical protein PBOI14_52650 [Pseudomonas sp. Boi14]
MRFYSWVLGIILLLLGSYTFADPVRQECLGRLTFDAPENIEWSTFAADEELISNGGGIFLPIMFLRKEIMLAMTTTG